jgi:signal peptidase II
MVRDQALRRWLLPFLAAVAVFAADQLTKLWAFRALGPTPCNELAGGCPRLPIIGTWFDLVYVTNTGVAFGLLRDVPQLFTIIPLLICAGAVYVYVAYLPTENRWLQAALGLVLGGGIGNVLDRLRYGSVVDFVRIGRWPVFNVADSAICVGMAIMAVYLLLYERATAPHPSAVRDDALLSALLSEEPNSQPTDDRQ